MERAGTPAHDGSAQARADGMLSQLTGAEKIAARHPGRGVLPAACGGAGAASTGESGTVWSELLRDAGAEVLARYAAGEPAITRNPAGTGRAWYLSTRLEDTALDRVIGEAAAAAGLAPVLPGLRPGAESARRRGGAARPGSPGCSC